MEERIKELEEKISKVIADKDAEIERLKKELEKAKKGESSKDDEADDEYAEELLKKIKAK